MDEIPALTLVNLFSPVAGPLPEELCQVLFQSPHVRIKRLVSRQHATPADHWYDQDSDEFVVLLAGSASLLADGSVEPIELRPGDAILLPAHRRHRVEWTDPLADTVWLAIHVSPS